MRSSILYALTVGALAAEILVGFEDRRVTRDTATIGDIARAAAATPKNVVNQDRVQTTRR